MSLHFLDTSVVLPSIISWRVEQYAATSSEYIDDKSYIKLTSLSVYTEAKGVLNQSRRVLTKFLMKTFEDAYKIDPMHLLSSLQKLGNSVAYEKWEKRIVNAYINDKQQLLFSVINGSIADRDTEITRIQNAVTTGLQELDKCCYADLSAKIPLYIKCPKDYTNTYSSQYSALMGRLNHQKDVKVILDAYFFSNSSKKIVKLVTLDVEQMISNKNFIDTLLGIVNICDFRKYPNLT